jgi:endonuclease/exonuclease/phosphatase family metal-dependent hydrolase
MRTKSFLSTALLFSLCFSLGSCTSKNGSRKKLAGDKPTSQTGEKQDKNFQQMGDIDLLADVDEEGFKDIVDHLTYVHDHKQDELTFKSRLVDSLNSRLKIVNDQYRKTQDKNLAAADSNIRLTVSTINSGLLCHPGLFYKINECEVRRLHFKKGFTDYLSDTKPDVVLVQEIWEPQDYVRMLEIADEHDYELLSHTPPTKDVRGSGLVILINKERFSEDMYTDAALAPYKSAVWETIADVDRGLLFTILTLENNKKVVVSTIHHTPNLPVLDYYRREKQKDYLNDTIERLSNVADHFIVGGDFNYSVDFNLGNNLGFIDTQLGGRTYVKFAEHNQKYNMMDTYRAVNDDHGYTWDEINNDLQTSIPFFKSQKRLDYIWLGSYDDHTSSTISSRMIFTEGLRDAEGEFITDDGKIVFLSDHFGVESILRLD